MAFYHLNVSREKKASSAMEKLSEYQAKERAKAAVWTVIVNTLYFQDFLMLGNT